MIAIIGIIAFVALGMYRAHHKVSYTAIVDFNELGSLQTEDAVVVRGYRVGSIASVKWLGDRSRIVIKFDDPLTIREGTQFNNINYALMGQRRLEIVPSKEGRVLPPDYVHQGHFEPGIAEALRLMENVNQQLTNMREMILTIMDGDSTHPSAQELYENIMGTVEGILVNAENSVNTLKPKLDEVFSQVNQASENLIEVTHQADTAVQTLTGAVNEKVAKAEEVIQTLSLGTQKANQIIHDLETAPAMDKLLNSKEAIEKVSAIMDKLNALVAAIDTKGIKVYDENGKPVKLITWKNTNLAGKTARQKAAERAEKGESLPE